MVVHFIIPSMDVATLCAGAFSRVSLVRGTGTTPVTICLPYRRTVRSEQANAFTFSVYTIASQLRVSSSPLSLSLPQAYSLLPYLTGFLLTAAACIEGSALVRIDSTYNSVLPLSLY